MPSIVVTPESPAESTAGGPLIAGVAFRRPRERSTTWEPVRASVTLGNGETRTFDNGIRRVVSLKWPLLTDEELATLKVLVAAPFVTYADDANDGVEVMCTDDGLSSDAVAGMFPVRHSASLTLKARKPLR